jgi:hypothetical protein
MIHEDETIWFPGIYAGRMGFDWVQKVADIAPPELVKLVQQRAQEDGEWAIANGFVGENNENEPRMRRMMEWVSNETNIDQCLGHILRAGEAELRSVDWVCRDLANASKWSVGG